MPAFIDDSLFQVASPVKPVMSASRTELDIELIVTEGMLPLDLCGLVYVNSSVGSVNSQGLPIPESLQDGNYNKEYGSPVMNGDAMVYCFDLTKKGKIGLKTRILKTPCYYADEASRYGTEWHDDNYGFRNMGISRMSLKLGVRNQLNTGIVPFKFKNEAGARILASYDVGRPFEFDPQSLKLITPLGANAEWRSGMPAFLKFPFALVQSTAHPVFDPEEEMLYTVNFTKSSKTMLATMKLLHLWLHDEEEAESGLEKIIDDYHLHRDENKVIAHLNNFVKQATAELLAKDSWVGRIVRFVENLIDSIKKKITTEDAVYLMQWNGKGPFKQWKVMLENNKPLIINQCMHQISLTRDFIILTDSSFKFSVDLLISNPFPHNPKIDRFIRELTTSPMEPYTDTFIIRRSDIKSNKKQVVAKHLKLPLEAVHFSANYDNPEGEITLYVAHNSAACMAEWLRPYDTLATEPGKPIDKSLIGMLALGDMDLGRIGKYVIDTRNWKINADKSEVLAREGNPGDAETGPHTWGVGLYTYRGMAAADENVPAISNIYYHCYGIDPRMLSDFIFKLYKDYPNRIVSTDKLLEYTRNGIPVQINRLNTATMELEDHFQFSADNNLRSLQFVPKQLSTEGVDDSMNGYILCTMINFSGEQGDYTREVWIFDAADLAGGPVCKLSHPDLDYAFTLHSAWIPELQKVPVSYKIDIEKDYLQAISKISGNKRRKALQSFFKAHVFPKFKN